MDSNKDAGKTGVAYSSTADGKIRAKVNKKNPRGETSLHIAARKGDLATCDQLIKEGIDVNGVDNAGWTALHEACSNGYYGIVDLLIRNGAIINIKSTEEGETPLHDAVQSGISKVVWLLLKSGADKTMTNNQGKPPNDVNYKGSAEINWLLTQPSVPMDFPFQSLQETSSRDGKTSDQAREGTNSAAQSDKNEDSSDDDGSNSDEEESEESRDFSTASSSRIGSIYSETNSRGRKRTRAAMANVTSRKPYTAVFNQPSSSGAVDIYEFRDDSPETDSDLALQKPIFGDARENRAHLSAEPSDVSEPMPKRQKPAKEAKVMSEPPYEESDASNHPTEDNSNKKVPPLRILLPKTPSEDNETETNDASKKPTRTKPITTEKRAIEKNGDSANTQRMTRSKVRQSGATLDEVPRWGQKRKGGHLRRGSNASAVSNATRNAGNSHQPTPELGDDSATNTEHERTVSPTAACMDEASRSSTGESEKGADAANTNDSSSPVLGLFSKTPYEGFYDLRAMVQNRWVKIMKDDASVEESAIRQMEQFSLTTNYVLADNPPEVSYKLNTSMKDWPEALRKLSDEQTKSRNELALAHKAERQKLLLFAEREYLRNMKRSFTIPTRTVSAVRIIRDAEIYNPLVLEAPEDQTPAQLNNRNQLAERLRHLATNLKNRHVVETQSLLAEQKYDWEKVARKSCEVGPNEKIETNFIPLVSVEEINLPFL